MNQELIQFASVALPLIFICAMGLVVLFATAIDHNGTFTRDELQQLSNER